MNPADTAPATRKPFVPGAEPDLFISTGSRDREAVDLLNSMFLDAARNGISDIHIEDEAESTRIRMRLNGAMQEKHRIARRLSIDVMTKVRMRAKLPLSETKVPLDGRFGLHYERQGLRLDVRVSIQPTIYGNSMVLRLLDQRNTSRKLDEIEMADEVREWIKILIREPHGLFLVTGPTGSGKTTTLYGILNELNDDSRKICTIEDPVEYRVPGLVQTNIEGNLDFAQVLRETLRQDPDIVLVGEIRDKETATIAVQAAMTGHLVLATVHSNSAPDTPIRVMDLGIDPNTLGTALRGVLAQRLVRRLVPETCDMRLPSDQEHKWLLMHDASHGPEAMYGVPRDVGDDTSPYDGRIAVMELLVVDRLVRNVLPLNDPKLIRSVARGQSQYRTLAQAGADLALKGMTSLSEARSMTSVSEALKGARTLGERLVEMGRVTPYQLDVCNQLISEASAKGVVLHLDETLIRQRYCRREDINEAEIV